MIDGLHHIGVAVRSLDEALPRWTDGLGLRLEGIEEVPTEKVRVAVLSAGSTRIELLEPTATDSPIARFLDKRGPGVHHLAFATPDTHEQIRVLTDAGAELLDTEPRPGAHGTRVAFVHPRWLGGVLAEMVQDPKGAE
jgi:methylmalonyl-CoA/ethylmalonyl-CoA epimerase